MEERAKSALGNSSKSSDDEGLSDEVEAEEGARMHLANGSGHSGTAVGGDASAMAKIRPDSMASEANFFPTQPAEQVFVYFFRARLDRFVQALKSWPFAHVRGSCLKLTWSGPRVLNA